MLKKRNLLFLSLLILGVLLLSSCFLNPPVTEGILKGQIMVPEGSIQAKDLTGEALPDATVNILDLSTGAIIATTTTDSNGHYQVSVPPGGPYLLEAVKDGVKLEQITCFVEVGIEYDLGTADCTTTAAALIAQAMMDAGDNPADIDCAAIIADPNFNDVSSIVCSTIKAGGDPTVSAVIEEAVEDFLNPPIPTPPPTPTYTVTFDTQGGSTVNSKYVKKGAKVSEPTAPTKEGYTFSGWYKESGYTTAWNFDSDTVIADVTLYAQWIVNTYTVTFDSQGGTTINSQTVKKDEKVNKPTDPTRIGYTFSGWYKESGCTNAWDFTNDTVTTNVTLYAQWIVNTYTVTFDKNGGDTEADPTTKTAIYGGNVGTLPTEPTRTGYTFTVWNTQANGSGTIFEAITVVTDDITVFAQWIVNTYTVTFDKNDTAATGTMAAQTIAYGSSANLTACAFSKTGWTFAGWITTSYGTIYDDEANYTMGTANVTLYAKWTPPSTYSLCDIGPAGGWIFYKKWTVSDGWRYLEAAPSDQSVSQWSNVISDAVGASAQGITIGTGQTNTTAIIAQSGHTASAAKLCDDLSIENNFETYDDWFLPSKDELNLMYENLHNATEGPFGGFVDSSYWSSSEDSASFAWFQYFLSGSQARYPKYGTYRVRAVRAF